MAATTDNSQANIIAAINEVSDKAQLLVREEIELAKAEVTEKLTTLARGLAIGIAAGVFVLAGLLMLLHGTAWLAWYVLPVGNSLNYFWGFYLVAGILFIIGGIAGFLAARWLRSVQSPAPEMAIEEAKLITRDREVLRPGDHDLAMPTRTPEEIRRSIESNRAELALSLGRLRGEVAEVTDWRKQIAKHRKQVVIGAAVAGFVIGGGIAALGGVMRRRRR